MPTAVLQIFVDLQNWKTLKTKSKIWDNVALLKKLVWHCHSLVYQGNCEKLRQSQSSRALDCIGQSTIPERQANKNSSSCIFGVTYWVFPEAISMYMKVWVNHRSFKSTSMRTGCFARENWTQTVTSRTFRWNTNPQRPKAGTKYFGSEKMGQC